MACVGGRTNPKLWESSKAEAKRKLGGRHSARAMQEAGRIYRSKGGGYCGSKTAAQKKLTKWTGEDWQTATGRKACRKVGGKTVCDRYLPAAAWSKLTPAQRRATRMKKLRAKGQYVSNTAAAKAAGRKARMGTFGLSGVGLLGLGAMPEKPAREQPPKRVMPAFPERGRRFEPSRRFDFNLPEKPTGSPPKFVRLLDLAQRDFAEARSLAKDGKCGRALDRLMSGVKARGTATAHASEAEVPQTDPRLLASLSYEVDAKLKFQKRCVRGK